MPAYRTSKLDMKNKLKNSCNVRLVNSVFSETDWNNDKVAINLTETLQQGKYKYMAEAKQKNGLWCRRAWTRAKIFTTW